MRKLVAWAVMSIVISSIALTGCGRLKIEDFDLWKGEYTAENTAIHDGLKDEISGLNGKVDEQNSSLTSAIAEAKEDAIAASEQGDADTIAAAKELAESGDQEILEELSATADRVADKAEKIARDGDAKVLRQLNAIESRTKTQATAISQTDSKIGNQSARIAQLEAKVAAAAKSKVIVTVNFASGRSSLTDVAKSSLDAIVRSIPRGAKVSIEGHADGTPVLGGSYRSNWDLSQARANSVAKYLKSKGVANEAQVVGYGHMKPIASVNTKAGRDQNRRVEVIVHPAGD